MGYVVHVLARDEQRTRGVGHKVRWRSDDPWGALWRCLYDACHSFIPERTDLTQPKTICLAEVRIVFEPDKEDFASPLFDDGVKEVATKQIRKPKEVKA